MQTPVALVVFKRPDLTAQVLAELAKVKPPILLVIADGPRPDRPEEAALCAETRALFDHVGWECDVRRNFAEVNMGLDHRVVDGFSWVFDEVEEAIFLEDDCLPDLSFFRYCDELLARYRHDTRVMQIAGTNFQVGYRRNLDSYHFSHYPTSTGWASWRRAWQHFDYTLAQLPAFRDGDWLFDLLGSRRAARSFAQGFDRMVASGRYHWEACWRFACWTQGGLIAVPNVNLIANLGYRPDGTHTHRRNWLADIQAQSLSFPLRHPEFILPDTRADRFNYYGRYGSGRIERGYGKAWRLWRTFRNRSRL
jgi:hypothetical protein